MAIFGKKEIEAKEREIYDLRESVDKLEKGKQRLLEEISKREENLALENQRLAHDRELFDRHQAEREEALKNQEAQMNQETDARRKMLESQKKDFEAHLQKLTDELNGKRAELEKNIIDLEKAKLEFEPKLRAAENDFAEKRAQNERENEERTTRTTEENLERQKEFDRRLHEQHQKSEKEHEDLLLEQTNKRLAETDRELTDRRNLVAKMEQDLRNKEIKIQNERDSLNQDLRDYEHKKASQDAMQKFLENRKAALDKEVQELADAKIKEANDRLDNYKLEFARLSSERAALETQLEVVKKMKSRFGDEEPEIILLKMQALEKQIAALKSKLAEYPEDVEKVLDSKDEEIQNLNDMLSEYKEKYRSVQNLAATAEISELTNSSLESQNVILKQDNERLATLNSDQAETIRKYKELFDREAAYAEKKKSIMAPHANFTAEKIRKEELVLEPEKPEVPAEPENSAEAKDAAVSENLAEKENAAAQESSAEKENAAVQNNPAESGSGVVSENAATEDKTEQTAENPAAEKKPEPEIFNSEMKWLENVSKKIADYGLAFSPRILNAFHTALKTADWSSIAVLAGVSGTGKSELPQLYAKFGGINCVNIPVQPNWDSQESLLGYYNTISSKFEAQPLLLFLVQAQLEHSNDPENDTSLIDQLNIVLLDEMNLAHIEQYFAEFLSKLEERRNLKEDDPKFPKLTVKLGGTDNYPLRLGRNVLWVGTMNQDETTKSLSDKVLDRGIVISFPRPKSFKRRVSLNSTVDEEEKYLSVKTWESWKMTLTKQQVEDSEKVIAPYKDFVEEINTKISQIGRAMGHRVWQSIENYIWNYPTVRDFILKNPNAFTDDSLMKDLYARIDPAFEDQLVQKIMPKLRGIETRGKSGGVLKSIGDKIDDFQGTGHALNIKEDFDRAIEFGDGQFLWVTSEYINMENDKQ